MIIKKSGVKKIAALALSVGLLLQATPSFAEPNTSTYEQQIESLNTKIRQYDNKIIEAMDKVEKLNKEVENAETRVEETKVEIVELEESYNQSLEISKDRIESIQLNGTLSYNFIDILLSSEGFSDFLNKTSAVITIIESDKQLMDNLTAKAEELNEKKASLDKDLASIEQKQAEAKAEQETIEKEKANILTELERAERALAEAQQEEAAEAARQAELERIRALAAAASGEETTQTTVTEVATNNNQTTSTTNLNKTETTTKPAVSVSSASAQSVISIAKQYLGVPYKWGGSSPSGFDCSGFTSYVYKKVGISLPRTSSSQQNFGTKVSLSNVQPGDLVFQGKPAYHVGIYIGGGQYIHAPQTGDVVKIASFNPSKFSSATRVLK